MPKPLMYRFYFTVLGGHTHIRVFAGTTPGALGKCGDLTMRNEEWADFRCALLHSGLDVEFNEEHRQGGSP